MIHSLIENTDSADTYVDELARLWLCLSQLDPRRVIKEQALIECISLQRMYRDQIRTDPGLVYALYAILYPLHIIIILSLLQENQPEKAVEIIKRGRSQSSSNVDLLFLESLYHYTYDSNPSLSLQLAETCCLTAFSLESHTLFTLLSSFSFSSLIPSTGPLSSRTQSLLLQSANFLLQSANPRLHLLAARTFIRLHLFTQASATCDTILNEAVDDSATCATAKLLQEFIQCRCKHTHTVVDTTHSFIKREGSLAAYLQGDETEVIQLKTEREKEQQELHNIITDHNDHLIKALKVRF